jgi:tight adherence protein C
MDNLILQLQGSLGNSELLILMLMFSAVVLLVLGGAGVVVGGNPVKRRLRTHVRRAGPASVADQAGRASAKAGKGKSKRLENNQTAADNPKTSAIRRKLIQAGYSGAGAVSFFFLSRIVAAVSLPVVTLFALPFVVSPMPDPSRLALIGFVAAIVGFYLPNLWVDHRINVRQTEARRGFPDALDMLLVCVEAGLSLAAALNRVGQEIGDARPLLGEQFKLVALEMQAGKSREQALRNMADRVGIDECRSLVTLLLQSESLGTSIGQSLRVHAEEMRRKRLVRAEERGNKLPAKMTIPLVVFILPALLSVIMTPLIITFIRIVAPALAGNV